MATISPWLDQKFYLADGITPNAGGKVFTYQPGTTTKKTTYVSESGAANANPIILNSAGECNLWLGADGYKIVNAPSTDTDPPSAAIKTWDNVNTAASTGLEYGVVSSMAELKTLTEGAFETVRMLGYYSANGIGSGLYYWDATSTSANNSGTIVSPNVSDGTGRWILNQTEPINVSQFGARGISSSEDTAAIIAASFGGAEGTLIIDADVILSTNVTLPSNVSVKPLKGSQFSGAFTLTINGPFECGLYQCFASTVTVVFGKMSAEYLLPQWWGAIGNDSAVTDSATAIQSAVTASIASFIPVYVGSGEFKLGSTILLNSNHVQILGAGPQNTIFYHSVAGAAFEIASTGTREYCRLENFGISVSGTPNDTGIDASDAPNTIIRNIWMNNTKTGILLGNAYNTVVDACRLTTCRLYGINAPSNTNDCCFINIIATCNDSASSRCMLIESCHGVSIKGGAFEDAEWAIEIQSGEVTFDGYIESCGLGGFLVTSNLSYLNILNVFSSNCGTTALVQSNASNSKTICQQARILTTSAEPAYIFDMNSGDASLVYGNISADETKYEPDGANFSRKVTGIVEKYAPRDGRDTFNFGPGVTAANDTTLGLGTKFEITGTTTINGFSTSGFRAGHNIEILAAASFTMKHNTAPSAGFAKLFLVGAVDVACAVNDTIRFMYDGTFWRQIGVLRNVSGAFSGSSSITSTGATGGIGYSTGAGGTVTQETSKATAVTLSKVSGQINLNAANLTADTTVSFVLTNTAIAATDILVMNHVSGGTAGSYLLNAQCAAGSASVNVRNITAGALAEAIVIGFVLVKGVTA